MSESFPSDALFGVDGTQMPEPLPDPLAGPGRGAWRDTAQLPPFVLPPLPDASTIREAIAAALADDPAEPVDQDDAAAPASPAAGQPNDPNANDAGAAPRAVAPAEASSAGPRSGEPPPNDGDNRSVSHRPAVAVPIQPTPSPPQRPPRQRDRPPTPAEPRDPMPPADLRRRIRRERASLSLQTRSDGGATAALIALLILMAVLLYYMITGFLQYISNFFQ